MVNVHNVPRATQLQEAVLHQLTTVQVRYFTHFQQLFKQNGFMFKEISIQPNIF